MTSIAEEHDCKGRANAQNEERTLINRALSKLTTAISHFAARFR